MNEYTDTELIELFGLSYNGSSESNAIAILESVRRVKSDTSKTHEEIASFIDFADKVAKRLGLPKLDHNFGNTGPTEDDVVSKAFSTLQPITNVNSHMLISHKARTEGFTHKQHGRESDEDRNPPGKINPVKVHTVFKAINIDSRFRDSYYSTKSTDFSVTLPTRITDCVKLQLGNLTIPLTAYCFSAENGNTTFVISVTRTPGPVTTRYVVTIPDGNYSTPFGGNPGLTSIKDIINTKMTEAGINTATDLSFDIDSITGKSVFKTPAVTTVTGFTIEFAVGSDGVVLTDDNIQLRLGWSLGFRDGIYNSSPILPSPAPYSIVSEGICVPVCPRYVFLVVDDYQPSAVVNYFNAGYQSSLLPNNVLTRIDVGSLNGGQGYYTLGDAQATTTTVNTTRSYFGPVTLEKLRLTLYDEYGRVINLNNMDWSVSFSMTCLYEQT